MSDRKNNLIWIDLEMTGLQPEHDRILEVCVVITDPNCNIIAESPSIVIWQPDSALQAMDNWNTNQHTRSGLLAAVKASTIQEPEAEQVMLAFIAQYVDAKASPMCGNSICQDRRFLAKHMPKLEQYFHYRHLDVSTLKILAQRFAPQLLHNKNKNSNHRAKDDIVESIIELKFYLEKFLNLR